MAEPVLRFTEPAQAVLNDDDRAVDDQAEIERAKAHQIARDARAEHPGNCHQHGDRNDRRSDERRADIAEQQEQDNDDEQGAFEQVLFHRPDGALDQIGTVIDRHGLYARWQRLGRFFKSLGRRLRDDSAILAREHEDRAEHHFLSVLGRGTRAQFLAHADIGDIRDADRHAAAIGDDDRLEIVNP